MIGEPIKLRPASMEICETVREWICDEDVRAAAFDPKVIPLDEHRQWFSRKIEDKNGVYWIAEIQNLPVRQIRFEKKNDFAEVSVTLAKNSRNKGLGTKLLKFGCAEFFKTHPRRTIKTVMHWPCR